MIGAYSTRNSMFDVGVAVFFGLVGYLMKKVNWPIAPLILGFLLAPMLEVSLSQSSTWAASRSSSAARSPPA